ncbi:MAG: HEAT repeat domain-containing protein [Acidobacteria bacterium]|nr:HEAT repeat domain-containing protein [Acidobacteriota bacterium]
MMNSPPRGTRRTRKYQIGLILCILSVLRDGAFVSAQEPGAPQEVSTDQLKAAIDRLGDFDYAIRTGAARTIRRTVAPRAVPALLQTVAEHADGYVRYRALVILTGFNDPRTKDAMRESRESPNDRLRTVAYSFFEHHPDPALINGLLTALDQEQGEFVRPTLVRALVAHGAMFDDPRIRQALVAEVGRGEDYFRGAVIEALGDYKGLYAFDALVAVAKLDGPLQDDAALALGKIGDRRALETLAMLQKTAPRQTQPTLAAAICLLGVNCGSHENYLIETLKFANSHPNLGFQELLRGAAAGLGALAVAGGHDEAAGALFDVGIPSHDPTRAPVSLTLGTIALRNTPLMLSVLGRHAADRDRAIDLVAEGFDMLEEDLDKETFFAAVRRAYWDALEGSASRQLMQTLIGKLDF